MTLSELELVKSLLSETGNKAVYRCSGEEAKLRLIDLGVLAYRLLGAFEGSSLERFVTLSVLFKEQFEASGQKTVIPKPKECIAAASIQSPRDTDCNYRNKDGNQVKGYSVNVTESCDKDGPNLISGVEVKKADAADNAFLESSVIRAEEVFGHPAAKIHADGAYHSLPNRGFVKGKGAELMLGAIQGAKGRYGLEMDEKGVLQVTDLEMAVTVAALKMEKTGKWRIKTAEHYRYFTDRELAACLLRKQIEAIPREELNIRNNVEATIFQLGYHYPNDKTRYRGLSRNKMWANIRCLWVNFVRIVKHVLKTDKQAYSELQIRLSLLPSLSSINRFRPLINKMTRMIINKSNLFSKTQILALS